MGLYFNEHDSYTPVLDSDTASNKKCDNGQMRNEMDSRN